MLEDPGASRELSIPTPSATGLLNPSNTEVTNYTIVADVANKAEMMEGVKRRILALETTRDLVLENDSVYGAWIAMPQIARSMGWNAPMTVLALRSLLMLALNYMLQISAIMFIAESSQVMDPLAGKMHLCDYAKTMDQCPDGFGCLGPGGTRLTGPRLYSFDIWSTRMFIRDSLLTLFPDKAEEIKTNVDPGEYGMENFNCRLLAVFVFIINEVQDIFKTLDSAMVLYKLPSKPESWVLYEAGGDSEAENGFDRFAFQIAGMPRHWKVCYVVTIVVPKLLLWWKVVSMGSYFLMQTAGIVDLVMGAMAMDFILTFDELILESIGSITTKYIMGRLLPCEAPKTTTYHTALLPLVLTIPKKLLITMIISGFFLWRYYHMNCTEGEDGAMVSKPMYLPLSTYYTIVNFLTGHVPVEREPFWKPPGGEGTEA